MNSIFSIQALEQLIDQRVVDACQPLVARIEELEGKLRKDYKTKQEAADYLGVSTSTIDNYVRQGLKKHKLTARRTVFSHSDLDDFMSKRRM